MVTCRNFCLGLLACLLAACSKPALERGDAVISDGKASLELSSTDPSAAPLYDRVDLLLLPAEPAEMLQVYPSSGDYFAAIREARGFYMGGDYPDDAERDSGQAIYELALPEGTNPPEGQSAWLLCLKLEGTGVEVLEYLPLVGWP